MVDEGRLLPVLVEIVTNHVEGEQGEVVADCCRFLQRLISHKELDIQSKLTEAGCLELMTKGLEAQPNARRLYIEICRLVALLCFDTIATPHADNQTDIANTALYELICARLEQDGISEEEAAAGCSAISALIYENDSNGVTAIHKYGILVKFSTLLRIFPVSLRVAHCIFQALFQLITREPSLSDDVVDTGMLQLAVELLDSSALMQEYRGPASFTVHWHIVKFLEINIRHNETNRVPLTRLGASRLVKLVYNNQEVASQPGLLLMCEHAVANIEGT
ncbi:hypothetical protein BBJ29_002313 [Phytophthora kernoviae]|uniref:Ataxin-10 domain-containing protein n=1 Tax=Phytophthora kernoviae TaxID=325452 RepID=A0A3F2RQK1_9STRA|nr:hypothetical protein BBJ29_002313 [Phytophthora kernoviae]RLN62314.1 hypothetical protein BBP00_00004848 [Phytophthora kernoviae]